MKFYRQESTILEVKDSDGKEVIRIEPNGNIFWHNREVKTDDDFRSAIKDAFVRKS